MGSPEKLPSPCVSMPVVLCRPDKIDCVLKEDLQYLMWINMDFLRAGTVIAPSLIPTVCDSKNDLHIVESSVNK